MTVADQWQTYRQTVMHPEAPDLQINECQMAFYAGAAAMYSLFMRATEAELTDEEGADCLETLQTELEAFGQAVKIKQTKPRNQKWLN